MIEQWRVERTNSQMTLGTLIDILGSMPPEAKVANLAEPHSYRGYYSDLALEPGDGIRFASHLLADLNRIFGTELYGYKGGEFLMGADTPVWVAYHGSCGKKLMSLGINGELSLADDDL